MERRTCAYEVQYQNRNEWVLDRIARLTLSDRIRLCARQRTIAPAS